MHDCHSSAAGVPVVLDVIQPRLFNVYQRFEAFNAFILKVKHIIKIFFPLKHRRWYSKDI